MGKEIGKKLNEENGDEEVGTSFCDLPIRTYYRVDMWVASKSQVIKCQSKQSNFMY